jgi:hypothetical protein
MARLEIEAAQEAVAAVLNDLDATVAAAEAAGDTRTPDQIRTDTAISRLTRGAHGTPNREQHSDPAEHHDDAADAAEDAAPSGSDAGGAGESRAPGAEPSGCGCPGGQPQPAAPGLSVSLTMTLSTWLGPDEDPAVLDRFGAIPAALARQIAREAARDHPITTTWRCIIIGDDHRSVLAAADPMRTPHHDPPPRLARLIDTIHPRCVFPGCPSTARRCDHDHRTPFETGGATCSCNLQPLCRSHHRLKGAGLITAHPIGDVTGGAGGIGESVSTATDAIAWTTASGRSYRYDTPPPVPEAADPHDQDLATARHQQRRRENHCAPDSDHDADHEPDADIARGEDLTWRDLVGPHAVAAHTSSGTGRERTRATGCDGHTRSSDGDGDTARHDAEHLSRPPQPPPF